jgi:hypothetical protein
MAKLDFYMPHMLIGLLGGPNPYGYMTRHSLGCVGICHTWVCYLHIHVCCTWCSQFSCHRCEFRKKVTICTIQYVLLKDTNKYVLLERSLDFPSTKSQFFEFLFNKHTSIIHHQKVATFLPIFYDWNNNKSINVKYVCRNATLPSLNLYDNNSLSIPLSDFSQHANMSPY